MKRILNLALAIALLASCHVQKEKLELNLVKGAVYTQHTVSNATIVQTINGQQMNLTMTVGGTMSFKVTNCKNSDYDMEVRFENLAMKMTLPNAVMEFSSEKNDAGDVLSAMLSRMKNKPFYVRMARSGKVREVKNVDSLFFGLFEGMPQLSDAQKQQLKDQLTQAYGEKAIKGNLEMVSAIFSDSPVSQGDKWTIHTQLESGMSGDVETVYQLKEITDGYELITGDSKVKTANKDAYIQSNGMPMRYNLAGTMTSTIRVNRKTGWIVDAKINQKIQGTAEIKENPKLPQGMIIPMALESELNITDK